MLNKLNVKVLNKIRKHFYEKATAKVRVKSCFDMSRNHFFCTDFCELWGAGDFLPERTAAPAVDAEGGNSPVLL